MSLSGNGGPILGLPPAKVLNGSLNFTAPFWNLSESRSADHEPPAPPAAHQQKRPPRRAAFDLV